MENLKMQPPDSFLLKYAKHGLFKPFKDSAFRKFRRKYMGHSFQVKTIDGLVFNITVGSSVENGIIRYGTFEPVTTSIIKSIATVTDGIIDIGCNIGYISSIYQLSNPDGKIISIDPNPYCIEKTELHLTLNAIGKPNFRTFQTGISSSEKELTLNLPEHTHSRASFAFEPLKGREKIIPIKVKTITLKSLIEDVKPNNCLLKVDTEGFESEVFSTFTAKMAENIPYIIFECHPEHFRNAKVDIKEFFLQDWMNEYVFYYQSGKHLKPFDRDNENNHNILSNLFLVSKSKSEEFKSLFSSLIK